MYDICEASYQTTFQSNSDGSKTIRGNVLYKKPGDENGVTYSCEANFNAAGLVTETAICK